MKIAQKIAAWVLILQLGAGPALLAQPVIIQPGNPFGNQQPVGNGVENLRVSRLSPDGTEAQLTMDYSYDGFGGPVAQILPVIGKKGQAGVSAWFGSDPVTVGRGRGTITLRVRFFNDEPGVPPSFTSDQVRILILNQTGTAVISAVPFLKNIKWGDPNAKPEPKITPPTLASVDKAAAERLAREKREAEARAKREAEIREQARIKAEAEVKARREAEEKALAEARAREESQRKAEAEARRIAQEKKEAEEIRLAQDRARAEEKKKADERARQEAAKALADAQARAEAKKRAEAEARRLEEERRLAEAKQIAEQKAREEARLRAEAEAQRLAEEKRTAEAKALAEAKARKEAEERAWQEAQAQAKAELAAKKLGEEKKQAEAIVQASAPVSAPSSQSFPSMELASDKKTKITNVDVVNRSLDRTHMTFGVEFEYKDQIKEPQLGIDVYRQSQPEVSRYFASQPAEIGRSRRNFALFPVKFQPSPELAAQGEFSTDHVMVYLSEKSTARRYNIFPATMLLRWRGNGSQNAVVQTSGNSVEIEDFKQNDPSNGHVTIKYNLLGGKGKLRTKIFQQSAPSTASYFTSNAPDVKTGSGVQRVDLGIDPDAKTASDLIRADTIEVELVDPSGQVLARASKQAAMVWARPRSSE